MWNSNSLTPPPTCELKVQLTPASKVPLNEARHCATKACKLLSEHLNMLESELFVIKRVIYKLSNQFRSDRALKSLRQVHSCLKRLKVLNLLKQFTEIHDSLGSISIGSDPSIYLPSCQFFEYKLLRLQGASALLKQTAKFSQKTFLCIREHLELGNMVSQNVVLLALCSRIWFVSNSLCLYLCEWYGKFYNCLDFLTPTAVQWLPDGDRLPPNITQWLTDTFGDYTLSEGDSEFVKQVTDKAIMLISDDSNVETVSSICSTQNEDVGEVISRQAVCKLITKPSVRQPLVKENMKRRKRKSDIITQKPINDDLVAAKVPKVLNEDKEYQINATVSSVSDMEADLSITIQSAADVDCVLEQVKAGSLVVNRRLFNLNNDKRSQLLQAFDKLKRKMKGNITSFMGQQLYLKKVRQCLGRILSNVTCVDLKQDCCGNKEYEQSHGDSAHGNTLIGVGGISAVSPSCGYKRSKKKTNKRKR